jgi:uncharacterized protein YcnI
MNVFSNRSSRIRALLISVALILVVTPMAFGHAVVYPKKSNAGAYEKYVLRVPNEKAVATTRVEIRFPADARVTSFGDVPGWQLEVLTDSAQRIVGAVWTGNLAPHRFVEFPFIAVNPKTATELVWPTFQTYADGERVEWTGPKGAKAPASTTSIAIATPEGATEAPKDTTTWVARVALALSLVSLGLALRPARRSA